MPEVVRPPGEWALVLIPLSSLFFLPALLGQAPFPAADGLLALNPAEFAFRNEPAFPAHCAQHTAARHFLPKALHQLLLGLIGSQFDSNRQIFSHPFYAALIEKGRSLIMAHPFRQ